MTQDKLQQLYMQLLQDGEELAANALSVVLQIINERASEGRPIKTFSAPDSGGTPIPPPGG